MFNILFDILRVAVGSSIAFVGLLNLLRCSDEEQDILPSIRASIWLFSGLVIIFI